MPLPIVSDPIVTLRGVLYVPTSSADLLSASKASSAGYSVEMKDLICEVRQKTQKDEGKATKAVVRAMMSNGPYKVQGWLSHNKAQALVTKKRLHKRCGHPARRHSATWTLAVTLQRTARSAPKPSSLGRHTIASSAHICAFVAVLGVSFLLVHVWVVFMFSALGLGAWHFRWFVRSALLR